MKSPAHVMWRGLSFEVIVAEPESAKSSYFSRRTGRRLLGLAGDSSGALFCASASLANRSAFKRLVFSRVA